MEKVIKVLEEKISSCEEMKVWYDRELERYQHTTADQMELKRLKIGQQDNFNIQNECIIAVEQFKKKISMKRETLEEACKRIKKELDYSEFDYTSFKLGAKWQQKQDKNKYSEDEVFVLLTELSNDIDISYHHNFNKKEWFEQIKKN